MPEIQTETKEQGSWSQFIEVGVLEKDRFGDTVFQRKGYPKDFPQLTVHRKFTGQGAAKRCRWIIEVPEGFPYVIRRVTNPGGSDRARRFDLLYTPLREQTTF